MTQDDFAVPGATMSWAEGNCMKTLFRVMGLKGICVRIILT